jgi:mevalonate kinase
MNFTGGNAVKEITINTKIKVIKLFLSGLSFDEIAQQCGIAKGSVVNIVNEFREGHLPLPPGMMEYIDQLRTLVVDMLKSNTTVSALKNYVKLHAKLQDMGVAGEQLEQWLDICQNIASKEVSSNQFVQSALELAQFTSGSGLSYADVITDYEAKLDASKQLDKDIGQKKEELDQLRAQVKEEKKQAGDILNSINQAIATAQVTYQEQKMEIDAQLKQYMAQNQLSWQKVNLVKSLLQSEFTKADLTQDKIAGITKEISGIGSRVAYLKKLGERKEGLKSSIDQLITEEAQFKSSVDKLGNINNKLLDSILENGQKRDALTKQIKEQEDGLAQLESVISGHKDVIGVSHLMLELLLAPESIPDNDIDQLTRLMLYVRQRRLGIEPEKVKTVDNELIYECRIPIWHFEPVKYGADMKEARLKLATLLAPCLKDEFMTKFEWSQEQLQAARQEFLDFRIEIPKIN